MLSVYNWNPGQRRGKEGAIEKQIAGTLQEAIEYVDHELLTNRFHVTHYGGCAVLFNKDTFFPDVKAKTIYLHDTRRDLPDKVMEGDSGWVLQGVLSRASFRRHSLSGQTTFTVLSLHISNIYAKKRGIGKKLILTIRAVMLGEKVDLVAGDFNGCCTGVRQQEQSVPSKKPLLTVLWRCLPAPHHYGDLDRFQASGLMSVGSSNLLNRVGTGKFGFAAHSPFPMKPRACARLIKAATTKLGSTSTSLVGMMKREKHDRRILLKERSAPYHYGKQKGHISDVMSDHSRTSVSATCNAGDACVLTMRPDDASSSFSAVACVSFLPCR